MIKTLIRFCFATVALACSATAAIPVILDTDMESDVDDVGALAMVHALADMGEINLLGVMVCAKNNWSTLCADRINTYFKRPDLSLGQLKGSGVNRGSAYAQQIAQEFPGKYASVADVPDALGLYRSILAAQPDNSVVLLTIGYTTNLRDLLFSVPDEHSDLDGAALIAQKVRLWMCMGGQFPSGYEANIRWDASASFQAIPVWPTDIIFAGWEVGNFNTGHDILNLPTSNPVRRSYQLFGQIPHKSWDQVAVLYAARALDGGPSAHHWDLSDPGRIVLDASGNNTWQADSGGTHRHLIQKSTNAAIAAEISALMMHMPPAGAPDRYAVTTSGTTAMAGAEIAVTAKLVDADGTEVAEAGRSVQWSATNGGSFSEISTLTDDTGTASVTFTTSSTPGTVHVVTATDADEPAFTGTSAEVTTIDPTADVHTLIHYHFDEEPGPADPGNPIVNYGSAGTAFNLTDTGGPDGRNNTGTGGYGAPGHPAFASAFDVLASGNGNYHGAANASGGGALTAAGVTQSDLQGADGAFTYEALIRLNDGIAVEQNIISHDGPGDATARGFLFRVTGGNLSLFAGTLSNNTLAELSAPIPTTGDHAFANHQWFHVAVTYSGAEGAAGNVRFYWTALNAEVPAANQIGTGTLPHDLKGTVSNIFGIGTTTRQPFRFEVKGLVDEVRISGIARQPDDFVFLIDPPDLVDTDEDGIPDWWEIQHGLDPETSNDGIDSDRDGIEDLMEFALGLNPVVPDRSGLPMVEDEDGFLTLTANRNADAGHLVFEVQVSADLEIWEADPEHVTVLQNTPTLLKVRDNRPSAEAPGRFIRLKVSVAE